MLHVIDARERSGMYKTCLAEADTAPAWVPSVIETVMSTWAKKLGPAKISLLLAITTLSLARKRGAVEVSVESLVEGFSDEDSGEFAGLGMSVRSARTHIDELCAENFIDVYRVLGRTVGRSGVTNVLEINFKTLFGADNVCKFCTRPYMYIHRYSVPSNLFLRLGTPNQESPVFDAARVAERKPMLAMPKKGYRVPQQREESSAGAVAAVKSKNARVNAARIAKVASTPVAKLPMHSVQAMLDKAMSTYLPDYPRVMATKVAYGVMRKRLAELQIADLQDFINWVVRSWSILSEQNRGAFLKDPSRGRKGTPLPSSPSFPSLAYRLPYFVAAYRNRLADGQHRRDRGSEQAQAARMRGELALAKRQVDYLKKLKVAPVAQRPAEEFTPTPLSKLRQTELDGWEPPAWEDRQATKRSA